MDDDYPDSIDVISCFPASTFHLDESLVSELQDRLEAFRKEQSANDPKK